MSYVYKIFYHVSLLQVFQLFQFPLFQVKMVNHCEGFVNFPANGYQLQRNILHHFLYYNFLQSFHQIQK